MQYLSLVTATERYSCLPNKLAIFRISSAQYFQYSSVTARVAVMYFIAKSCIHTVQPPEHDQKSALFVPLLPASTEFHKITRKQKFRRNGQIPRLCSKFRILQKIVVPTHDISYYGNGDTQQCIGLMGYQLTDYG